MDACRPEGCSPARAKGGEGPTAGPGDEGGCPCPPSPVSTTATGETPEASSSQEPDVPFEGLPPADAAAAGEPEGPTENVAGDSLLEERASLNEAPGEDEPEVVPSPVAAAAGAAAPPSGVQQERSVAESAQEELKAKELELLRAAEALQLKEAELGIVLRRAAEGQEQALARQAELAELRADLSSVQLLHSKAQEALVAERRRNADLQVDLASLQVALTAVEARQQLAAIQSAFGAAQAAELKSLRDALVAAQGEKAQLTEALEAQRRRNSDLESSGRARAAGGADHPPACMGRPAVEAPKLAAGTTKGAGASICSYQPRVQKSALSSASPLSARAAQAATPSLLAATPTPRQGGDELKAARRRMASELAASYTRRRLHAFADGPVAAVART